MLIRSCCARVSRRLAPPGTVEGVVMVTFFSWELAPSDKETGAIFWFLVKTCVAISGVGPRGRSAVEVFVGSTQYRFRSKGYVGSGTRRRFSFA